MSFVSFEFIALFAVIVPLYYALPRRAANLALLGASYFFYAYWYPPYLALLVLTTLGDYLFAKKIEASATQAHRRAWLIASLCLNLGVLGFFKYSGFVMSLLHLGSGPDASLSASVGLALPIGISFYTFQEMSYVIEVYQGKLAAVRRFTDLSTFISFFPQLIAGPIERASRVLPQFAVKHEFNETLFVSGARLMLLGFFKKLVIADRLAMYVNSVYDAPAGQPPAVLALATVFFAAQIYADFSAYSDMAIGAARVLGFDLMMNFRQPYLAKSIRDFWHRWHISLSTWFRDYVYFPLGGSHVSTIRQRANVMIVFLLSGLWHGAHLKFVLWGALHGAALVAQEAMEKFVGAPTSRVARWSVQAATLLFVCLAWVPFRAGSLGDTLYIWRHLWPAPISLSALAQPAGNGQEFIGMLAALGVLVALDVIDARFGLWSTIARWPRAARWGVYYATSFAVLWLGVWGHYDFIYFQF